MANRATPPPAAPPSTAIEDRPLVGILLMIAAMSVVPFMDAIAKELSGRLPVMQIVWARYFFHFCLILPVVLLRYGPRQLLPRRPALQLLRHRPDGRVRQRAPSR